MVFWLALILTFSPGEKEEPSCLLFCGCYLASLRLRAFALKFSAAVLVLVY